MSDKKQKIKERYIELAANKTAAAKRASKTPKRGG